MSSVIDSWFGEESSRIGSGSRLSSQRFDSARYESFADYAEGESMNYGSFEDEFPSIISGADVVEPTSGFQSEVREFVANEQILPHMEEEFSAIWEWRRVNAIRLEAKEKKEKEILQGIIAEADNFKAEYYSRLHSRYENTRTVNREREKLFLESIDKFHSEAEKTHWKSISELLPNEVPIIEMKGKKTPSVVTIQGPKPGKPTDLSRMRQILTKLKNKPPAHVVQSSTPVQVEVAESQGPSHDVASTSTSGNQEVAPLVALE